MIGSLSARSQFLPILLATGSEAFEAVRQLAACLPAPLGGQALGLAAALRLVVLAQQVCVSLCVCARVYMCVFVCARVHVCVCVCDGLDRMLKLALAVTDRKAVLEILNLSSPILLLLGKASAWSE
eukprot:1161141-Pelagomonas_calceolata.AAC.7